MGGQLLNILNLLDVLEDELESGVKVPFAGKALIDREKCLDIIRDIRLNLPDEIRQAELLKKERRRILVEAQEEAEAIIKDAERRIEMAIDEHEVTQKAYQQAREIMEQCQNSAREIRLGADEYADGLLQQVEEYLIEQLEILRKNRQELNSVKR